MRRVEHPGMPIRRIILTLVTVALVLPVGLFVHQQWRDASTCKREFDRQSEDYEICTEYGASPEGFCANLDRDPFDCSEEFIAGRRKLVAARRAGLFQVRLDCAAGNQVSLGTPCSPEQWDGYCSTYHRAERTLPRCRAVGPVGREGVPPAELQANPSAPVGPLSGPRTECGTLTTYEQPGINPGSVAVDADGSVWFTEPRIGALSHMTLTGKITRQFLWTRPGLLSRGPSGDLWFATNDAIWQRSPSGETRRYAALPPTGHPPTPGGPTGSGLTDMTVGADGSIWILQSEVDRLGRINSDGTITDVPLTRPGDGYIRPTSLTAGPDGSVWVSAALARRLARVDGRTLTVKQFQVSTGGGTVDAQSVAADAADGAWFERSTGSAMDSRPSQPALGHVDRTGKITYHPLPGGGPRWPGSLTAGPDGAIWFLDGPAKTVGRMAPDGTVTEFPFAYPDIPGPTTEPLAAGSRNLWFSQPHTSSLGRITCR